MSGEVTIPEFIADDRTPYYDALVSCDRNYAAVAGHDNPAIDASPMEELMKKLVAKQLSEVARAAGAI